MQSLIDGISLTPSTLRSGSKELKQRGSSQIKGDRSFGRRKNTSSGLTSIPSINGIKLRPFSPSITLVLSFGKLSTRLRWFQLNYGEIYIMKYTLISSIPCRKENISMNTFSIVEYLFTHFLWLPFPSVRIRRCCKTIASGGGDEICSLENINWGGSISSRTIGNTVNDKFLSLGIAFREISRWGIIKTY